MHKSLLFGVVSLVLLVGCYPDRSADVARLEQEVAQLKAELGPPPASLDNLYPPNVDAPIFQIRMLEMARPLTGLMAKATEGDQQGAKSFFNQFKTQYEEVSNLVPEWKTRFPQEPVMDVEKSIDTGDPEKIMTAFGKLAKVCSDCHLVNMPKVQYKYHWQDFSIIRVSDPVTKRDMDFKELMMGAEMSFSGIAYELGQGQPERARQRFEAFNGSMRLIKETCQGCHESERHYFVDKDVQALITKLGSALKSPSPNMELIVGLSQQIGMESCAKCHLVHIPAAYAKARWATPKEETAK